MTGMLAELEHRRASNDGIGIHYVTGGAGPAVLFIHGFPDFWYGWRYQLSALADRYQVIAMDQRGYNLSDAPAGSGNYRMDLLVSDAIAVLRHAGHDAAIIVGHDWGGAVGWHIAMQAPEAARGLVVLATPHPRGLARELSANPAQREASEYALRFCLDGSEDRLDAARLTEMVAHNVEDRLAYREAFARSDIRAMMDYYRCNFHRPHSEPAGAELPSIRCPTLLLAGLQDGTFVPDCFAGTWLWIDAEFTLVTLPGIGHSPQVEAPDIVNGHLSAWLARHG